MAARNTRLFQGARRAVIVNEAEARRIERLLLNATRPQEQREHDGWLLRLAKHDVKRASSINPIGASALPLDEKITQCEAIYEEQDLSPLFRLTPFAQPGSLDEALSRRGYERFEPSVTMSASLLDAPLEGREGLSFEIATVERWLDLTSEIRGLAPERQAAERRRLLASSLDRFAVIAWEKKRPAGCGLVMLQDGYAGLFDIATAPERRGMGIGRAMCLHLMHLAQQHGAERAWLSVVADNEPALRLYEKLGFGPLYDYWYRAKRAS